MRFAEVNNVFLQPTPNRFPASLPQGYSAPNAADTVLTTEDGTKIVTEDGLAFLKTEN
ncbi:MAG: hypothetical protein WCS94_08305 [Verrucomicrobiota bacterium]